MSYLSRAGVGRSPDIKPERQVEAFAQAPLTDDGLLRAAVFKGLRDDLTPRRRARRARTGARTRLTSPKLR
jgi:hypothetical protein